MELTNKAAKRLAHLLTPGAAGFSVVDFVGTCRGSTPVIQPVQGGTDDQVTITDNGITFFVKAELAEDFRECTLDYDPSFFGKGLTATWPHRSGCNCHS
jgi:Fe-S cluster assembly iron-binding protein IscA